MNDDPWLLGNEFAQVRVWIDRSGHDPRLVIEDLAMAVYLVHQYLETL